MEAQGVVSEGGVSSLLAVLESVPDPRGRRGRRHALAPILALGVCAMLCGARSLYAIAQWGREQGEATARALGFTRQQTPCASTLHYLFRRLDRGALETALGQWLQPLGLPPGSAMALDGKTLRGIHGEQVPGVHLIAAYAHHTGVVVAQQAVEGTNELGAVPALLEQLHLAGRVVTGDAHFTQRELCHEIVEKGGATSSPSRTISAR